tara:strand:+ start:9138 stop:9620 length:483 start_codon:yes stop_codon:yes gene_type:complete
MIFPIHLSGAAKPAFVLVATHGLTDLDSLAWVAPYSTLALLPLPTEGVTALFCAASVYHFAADGGPFWSLTVHTAVLVIGLLFGVQTAFMAMLAYLALIHVPGHYVRCVRRGRGRAVQMALAVGVATALFVILTPEIDLAFGDSLQKLVVAHVLVEAGKS